MEEPVLDTGRKRALARQAQDALKWQKYYANTTFLVNPRAEKRRMKKLVAKHERAMEVRNRFRKAISR